MVLKSNQETTNGCTTQVLRLTSLNVNKLANLILLSGPSMICQGSVYIKVVGILELLPFAIICTSHLLAEIVILNFLGQL